MRSSKGEVKTNLQVQNTATVTEITYGSILQGKTMQCSPKVFSKGYLACCPSKILHKSVIISSDFAGKSLNVKLHSDIRHTFHTKEGEYSSSVSCSLICWARTACTKRDVNLPHSVLWTEQTSESLSSPPFLFCSQHTILAS